MTLVLVKQILNLYHPSPLCIDVTFVIGCGSSVVVIILLVLIITTLLVCAKKLKRQKRQNAMSEQMPVYEEIPSVRCHVFSIKMQENSAYVSCRKVAVDVS